MWNNGYALEELNEKADQVLSRSFPFISNLAQTYQVDIVAGSVSNKRNNKVYNTAFTVSKEGRRINKYDKVHLVPMLNEPEFLEDGKIAFTDITKQDEENANAEPGDHEGIVEEGRDVEGVEVSVFLRQREDKTYKVSLRSNDYVNVSDVALVFGGGGHVKAAGCKMSGTPEQIKSTLVSIIRKYLK